MRNTSKAHNSHGWTLPSVVNAQPVRQFNLLQGLLQQPVFAVLYPRPRKLVLIEDSKLQREFLTAVERDSWRIILH